MFWYTDCPFYRCGGKVFTYQTLVGTHSIAVFIFDILIDINYIIIGIFILPMSLGLAHFLPNVLDQNSAQQCSWSFCIYSYIMFRIFFNWISCISCNKIPSNWFQKYIIDWHLLMLYSEFYTITLDHVTFQYSISSLSNVI